MKTEIKISFRLVALLLAILLTLSFVACKKKSDSDDKVTSSVTDTSSDTISSDDTSSDDLSSDDTSFEDDEIPVIDLDKIQWGDSVSSEVIDNTKPQNMLDLDEKTYWSPETTETVTVEFSLPESISFNAIEFVEKGAYTSELIVEAQQNGSYVQLSVLDEVGQRTTILDTDYNAKNFRITFTASNENGGISEIKFVKKAKLDNMDNFRKVGYLTCNNMDANRSNAFDKIADYTDVILFDFGSWNENGDFLWESMYSGLSEKMCSDVIDEIRSLPGTDNLDIWFCLQSFDKTNIKTNEDTEKLFATAESRKKLTDFAVYMCETYDLTGIDIDYEYPRTAKAWANYDKFINECASALHAKGYKFSFAASLFGVKLSADTISKIDYVNAMAYDIYDNAGRHSSYNLAKTAIIYFSELGFKREQIVVGLPFYPRTMDETRQIWSNYDGVAKRWRGSVKPWVNVVSNRTWTYYFNGANMIRDKVYMSMEEGASGVFCWNMRSDVANDNKYGVVSLGQTVIDTIERFSK